MVDAVQSQAKHFFSLSFWANWCDSFSYHSFLEYWKNKQRALEKLPHWNRTSGLGRKFWWTGLRYIRQPLSQHLQRLAGSSIRAICQNWDDVALEMWHNYLLTREAGEPIQHIHIKMGPFTDKRWSHEWPCLKIERSRWTYATHTKMGPFTDKSWSNEWPCLKLLTIRG